MSKLPTPYKEKDIAYQRIRINLFKDLLKGYPQTRPQIINEVLKIATVD